MVFTFAEALKKLKVSSKNMQIKKIKLVNNQIIEGKLIDTCQDMIVVEIPNGGAGSPRYTIPTSAILYISDCEL